MINDKTSNYPESFTEYMDYIISHPNYSGLAIEYKKDGSPRWVAAKKSTNTGKLREEWANKKAKELGFENSSKKFADTMFKLHPTKIKVCQCCGKSMDLRYVYPTAKTVNYFEKNFNYEFNRFDTIKNIFSKIKNSENEIKCYLVKKAGIDTNYYDKSIDEIITAVEFECRMNGKRILSPGAMSNFPDRFDGFHSYNLCCRKKNDKGRHDVNMASYSQDRRAYEYWSDGNIAAANQLMRNPDIFKGTSADHIGPISLGFKHDPLFLQPMLGSENSSKRDRLLDDDINKLIKIEDTENVSPASFFSIRIWKYIRDDYSSNNPKYDLEYYRNILKQNMANFMESLWILMDTDNNQTIKTFFEINYFSPKYEEFFKYKYTFNADGHINGKISRRNTESAKDEYSRIVRISFDSIYDYHNKSIDNRNIKPDIPDYLLDKLNTFKKNIESNKLDNKYLVLEWENYILELQNHLIPIA